MLPPVPYRVQLGKSVSVEMLPLPGFWSLLKSASLFSWCNRLFTVDIDYISSKDHFMGKLTLEARLRSGLYNGYSGNVPRREHVHRGAAGCTGPGHSFGPYRPWIYQCVPSPGSPGDRCMRGDRDVPGDRDMHGGQQFVPLPEIIVA
jgi:hypothetical protein